MRRAARTGRLPPADLGGQVSGGAGRGNTSGKRRGKKINSCLRVYQAAKAEAASR